MCYAGIVEALVDSAADKSETTRHAVLKALVDIGRKKHNTVLAICHSYLKKHSKVSSVERVFESGSACYDIICIIYVV